MASLMRGKFLEWVIVLLRWQLAQSKRLETKKQKRYMFPQGQAGDSVTRKTPTVTVLI